MTDFIHATTSRLHLDTGRIRLVLHTFSAAAIPMFLVIGLGLEHPNWSAMGALSSSQPTRERIFLKGSLRVAGSVIGAIVGVLILLLTSADHLLIASLLSLWVGFWVVGAISFRGLIFILRHRFLIYHHHGCPTGQQQPGQCLGTRY